MADRGWLTGPRAILEAAAAASPIAKIVLDIIDAFLGDARKAVLPGGPNTPPDMTAWPGEGAWEPRVRRFLLPPLRTLYTGRWERMDVTADPRDWARAYVEAVPSRLRSFPAQAFEFVRGVIADAVAEGAPTPMLRDRIGMALGIDAPSRVMIDKIGRLDQIIADPDSTTAQRDKARAARRAAYASLREADLTWHWRAERIARTEATGALNAATVQSLQAQSMASGLEIALRWVATRHPPASAASARRTRDTHREAHGQVVPAGQPFVVGEALLYWPGDPTGPPQEVINCRCACVPV